MWYFRSFFSLGCRAAYADAAYCHRQFDGSGYRVVDRLCLGHEARTDVCVLRDRVSFLGAGNRGGVVSADGKKRLC